MRTGLLKKKKPNLKGLNKDLTNVPIRSSDTGYNGFHDSPLARMLDKSLQRFNTFKAPLKVQSDISNITPKNVYTKKNYPTGLKPRYKST